jgi:hypothetical protein
MPNNGVYFVSHYALHSGVINVVYIEIYTVQSEAYFKSNGIYSTVYKINCSAARCLLIVV